MDEDQTWVGTLPHICSNDVLHLVFFFSSWREGTNEDDHERLSIWYSRYGAPAMFAVIIKKER